MTENKKNICPYLLFSRKKCGSTKVPVVFKRFLDVDNLMEFVTKYCGCDNCPVKLYPGNNDNIIIITDKKYDCIATLGIEIKLLIKHLVRKLQENLKKDNTDVINKKDFFWDKTAKINKDITHSFGLLKNLKGITRD